MRRSEPHRAGTDPLFAEVLEGARRGDPAALRMLYDRLVGPVASYLRARGVREVDDITSEVFLAVFTDLSKFRGGEPELRAWVLTIAHHRWVDEQRRASRRVATTDYDPATDTRHSRSAEEHAMDNAATMRVRDRLRRLSPDQQEVLLLRLVEDLTVEQVAKVLGKRIGAVKALQRRGLAALRKTIDEEGVPL